MRELSSRNHSTGIHGDMEISEGLYTRIQQYEPDYTYLRKVGTYLRASTRELSSRKQITHTYRNLGLI